MAGAMKARLSVWVLCACWAAFGLNPMARAEEKKGKDAGPAAKPEGTVAKQPPEENFTNSIGMELVRLPGGFWAGRYEVTQKEYQKVMGANPSAFKAERNPVDSVSWKDTQEFCQKLTALDLNEQAIPVGFAYSLPTETQWEAMMADASLADAVTSEKGRRNGPKTVGSLRPNRLGLYDVRGNVWEFCQGDTSKPFRVLRGASWQDDYEANLRPVFRYYANGPDERRNTFGFRCILTKQTATR
jgi:formylglycine-generating enzyme required for sulfatase activity